MKGTVGKKLVIVDPALMTASGHHAGLATVICTIVSATADSADDTLEYICHKDIDAGIKDTLEQAGIKVTPAFTINFYQYFDQVVRLADMQEYVQQAVREYRAAISMAEEPTLYFHPSLNWEHAYILALALRMQPPTVGVLHKCCLMFNPGVDHWGGDIDRRQELNYAMAFKALCNHEQVQIFASDIEVAEKYQRVLETNYPIPICPSYLADWQSLPISGNAEGNVRNVGQSLPATTGKSPQVITLYLGEAKINKGFAQLPDLARQMLQSGDAHLKLYVQYTHCWPNEDIETAIDALNAISAADPRLVLDNRYLSDAALHERLRNTDIFVFLYDEKDYGEKSSGILQLVAWYGLNTIFLTNTWLNREAKRLGLPMLELRQDDFTAAPITWWLDHFTNTTPDETNAQYRQQLYAPFWHWLQEGTAPNEA